MTGRLRLVTLLISKLFQISYEVLHPESNTPHLYPAEGEEKLSMKWCMMWGMFGRN